MVLEHGGVLEPAEALEVANIFEGRNPSTAHLCVAVVAGERGHGVERDDLELKRLGIHRGDVGSECLERGCVVGRYRDVEVEAFGVSRLVNDELKRFLRVFESEAAREVEPPSVGDAGSIEAEESGDDVTGRDLLASGGDVDVRAGFDRVAEFLSGPGPDFDVLVGGETVLT